jgi:hypothetical protein
MPSYKLGLSVVKMFSNYLEKSLYEIVSASLSAFTLSNKAKLEYLGNPQQSMIGHRSILVREDPISFAASTPK